MTTKNEQRNRLAQILERPEADQWYPAWDDSKVWAKIEALSEIPVLAKRRKYWLWILAFGMWWVVAGAERLELPKNAPQVPYLKEVEPLAHLDVKAIPEVAPIDLSAPKVKLKQETRGSILAPAVSTPSTLPDSSYNNMEMVSEKMDVLPALSSLSLKVPALPQSLLPPQPWRKKRSTLYTLKVPEIPFDWDMRNGFVQRLERQIKFSNQPNNGWIAFQVHWDSGTAFTLVHQSRDSIPVQHPEIKLHHTTH